MSRRWRSRLGDALVVIGVVAALGGGAMPAGAMPGGATSDGDLKQRLPAIQKAAPAGRDGLFATAGPNWWLDTADDRRIEVRELDGSAMGATQVELSDGEVTSTLDCDAGEAAMAAVPGPDRALLAVLAPRGACAVGSEVLGEDDGTPRVLLLDPARPDAPVLRGVVDVPGAAAVLAAHPRGRHLYIGMADLVGGRGELQVLDITDIDGPVEGARVPLALASAPVALHHGTDGRLYVASGSTTLVLDTTDPARPEILGRIADPMVRNHRAAAVHDVIDPTFGARRFLTIESRLGGGSGCRTGSVTVYDVTGALRDTPMLVATSNIPEVGAVPGEACPQLRTAVDAQRRRVVLTWTSGVDGELLRADSAPYDITAAFQARAELCRLVPAS